MRLGRTVVVNPGAATQTWLVSGGKGLTKCPPAAILLLLIEMHMTSAAVRC